MRKRREAGDSSGYELGRLEIELATFGDLLACLLYTSDAADDLLCVDVGGRRIIQKKTRRSSRPENRSPSATPKQLTFLTPHTPADGTLST